MRHKSYLLDENEMTPKQNESLIGNCSYSRFLLGRSRGTNSQSPPLPVFGTPEGKRKGSRSHAARDLFS